MTSRGLWQDIGAGENVVKEVLRVAPRIITTPFPSVCARVCRCASSTHSSPGCRSIQARNANANQTPKSPLRSSISNCFRSPSRSTSLSSQSLILVVRQARPSISRDASARLHNVRSSLTSSTPRRCSILSGWQMLASPSPLGPISARNHPDRLRYAHSAGVPNLPHDDWTLQRHNP